MYRGCHVQGWVGGGVKSPVHQGVMYRGCHVQGVMYRGCHVQGWVGGGVKSPVHQGVMYLKGHLILVYIVGQHIFCLTSSLPCWDSIRILLCMETQISL